MNDDSDGVIPFDLIKLYADWKNVVELVDNVLLYVSKTPELLYPISITYFGK